MIKADFFKSGDILLGFSVEGHAGYNYSSVNSIVCAAVSSAVQLTVNNITEIFKINGIEDFKDNLISFRLKSPNQIAGLIISGLRLHLQCLAEDYPETITIQTLEV